MRWKHTIPTVGENRTRGMWLLLPKCIGVETRWLEYAEWNETYVCYEQHFDPPYGPVSNKFRWMPVCWIR